MLLVAVTRTTRVRLLLVFCIMALAAGARACVHLLGARLVSSTLKPITRVNIEEPLVCLTFDVTYGESAPDEVLDALSAAGAKCTFFVAGPWAAAHPDVVKRIVKNGHELGSQGYWHENLSTCDTDRVRESIVKTHELLKGIGGVEPSLFRPPNGDWNDSVIRTALEVGYNTVTWSLDSHDWRTSNEDYIIRRVVRETKPGDIVRFHASDLSGQTPRALPRVLEGLEGRGLRLVTVSYLLKHSSK